MPSQALQAVGKRGLNYVVGLITIKTPLHTSCGKKGSKNKCLHDDDVNN